MNRRRSPRSTNRSGPLDHIITTLDLMYKRFTNTPEQRVAGAALRRGKRVHVTARTGRTWRNHRVRMDITTRQRVSTLHEDGDMTGLPRGGAPTRTEGTSEVGRQAQVTARISSTHNRCDLWWRFTSDWARQARSAKGEQHTMRSRRAPITATPFDQLIRMPNASQMTSHLFELNCKGGADVTLVLTRQHFCVFRARWSE